MLEMELKLDFFCCVVVLSLLGFGLNEIKNKNKKDFGYFYLFGLILEL